MKRHAAMTHKLEHRDESGGLDDDDDESLILKVKWALTCKRMEKGGEVVALYSYYYYF